MTERGQTLLEVTIGLGLVLVIVTAITITNINGLNSSKFSQNQTQATKLAQEGIDLVRNIRDQDNTLCHDDNVVSQKPFSGVWDMACSGCTFVIKTSGSCAGVTATTSTWLDSNSNPETITLNNLVFKRSVTIYDVVVSPTNGQKEIKVMVSWNDPSGTHNSQLSTILSQR